MILVLGMSGAGKGTQSERLAAQLGYTHISSGELVRLHANEAQRQQMLQGAYLSDADILALLEDALKDVAVPSNIILDGLPRTIPQAEYLLAGAAQQRWRLEAVIFLTINPEQARKRMMNRSRIDDTEAAISTHIDEYTAKTVPVISFLQEHGLPVITVDGSRSIEEVDETISSKLKEIKLL